MNAVFQTFVDTVIAVYKAFAKFGSREFLTLCVNIVILFGVINNSEVSENLKAYALICLAVTSSVFIGFRFWSKAHNVPQ